MKLILVRTARNGIPLYFVVSLFTMSDLGGASADSIKATIDRIFCEGDGNKVQGPVPLWTTGLFTEFGNLFWTIDTDEK